MVKRYINLTNGIEAIPVIDGEYSFIRIQSTACEQHLWDKILLELDYDFLMNVALGNQCLIYDFGANKIVPRSVYQGVKFIVFVLEKRWYGRTTTTYVARGRKQGCDVTSYFNDLYSKLSKETFKKLDYFKMFLCGGSINIGWVTGATQHDNDKIFYSNLMKQIHLTR